MLRPLKTSLLECPEAFQGSYNYIYGSTSTTHLPQLHLTPLLAPFITESVTFYLQHSPLSVMTSLCPRLRPYPRSSTYLRMSPERRSWPPVPRRQSSSLPWWASLSRPTSASALLLGEVPLKSLLSRVSVVYRNGHFVQVIWSLVSVNTTNSVLWSWWMDSFLSCLLTELDVFFSLLKRLSSCKLFYFSSPLATSAQSWMVCFQGSHNYVWSIDYQLISHWVLSPAGR